MRPKPAQNKHSREHAREIKRFVAPPPHPSVPPFIIPPFFVLSLFVLLIHLQSWILMVFQTALLLFVLFLLTPKYFHQILNLSSTDLNCTFFKKNILTVHRQLKFKKAKQHYTKATLSISSPIQTTLCLIPCVSENGKKKNSSSVKCTLLTLSSLQPSFCFLIKMPFHLKDFGKV